VNIPLFNRVLVTRFELMCECMHSQTIMQASGNGHYIHEVNDGVREEEFEAAREYLYEHAVCHPSDEWRRYIPYRELSKSGRAMRRRALRLLWRSSGICVVCAAEELKLKKKQEAGLEPVVHVQLDELVKSSLVKGVFD